MTNNFSDYRHINQTITLADIAKNVNSVNYKEELVVFNVEGNTDNSFFPVRIDALMIGLILSGSGKISVDMKKYDFNPNDVLVTHPNSFITGIDSKDNVEAIVLVCSKNIVENVLPKMTDLLPLLMETHTGCISSLTSEEAGALKEYIRLLCDKLAAPETPFKRHKVLCILQAMMFEMMESQHSKSAPADIQKSRREEIMAKFLLAVTEYFRKERQVTFYADKLCITPKHLSAVVKDISGHTAGEWIDNYVVMEAKVLLHSTDRTIQEIAMQLNFANQSFFGKYFKHHTGVSPSVYRRMNS